MLNAQLPQLNGGDLNNQKNTSPLQSDKYKNIKNDGLLGLSTDVQLPIPLADLENQMHEHLQQQNEQYQQDKSVSEHHHGEQLQEEEEKQEDQIIINNNINGLPLVTINDEILRTEVVQLDTQGIQSEGAVAGPIRPSIIVPSQSNIDPSQDSQNMSAEDDKRSSLIAKNIFQNWLNVYVYIIMESARFQWDFDFIATILVLCVFDFLTLTQIFIKYKLNSKQEIDQNDESSSEQQQQLAFKQEYNRFLLSRAAEILVFIVFKILLILRFKTGDRGQQLNLTIISILLIVLIVIKILYSLRIKIVEFNPIINEKFVWLFKSTASLQVLFASMKIEGQIQWTWLDASFPSIIFLIALLIVFLGFFAMFMSKCCNKQSRQQNNNPSNINNSFFLSNVLNGLGWILIMQASLIISSSVYIRAYLLLKDRNDGSMILTAFILSVIMVAAVMLLTLLKWHSIKIFLYEVSILLNEVSEDRERVVEQEFINGNDQRQQSKKLKKKQKLMNILERKDQDNQHSEPVFMHKLSSTYFSALSGRRLSTKAEQLRAQKALSKKTLEIMKHIQETSPQKLQRKQLQRKSSTRQKSQSFMIKKDDNSMNSFRLQTELEMNFSAYLRDQPDNSTGREQQQQQQQQQNQWQKLAIDTNKKLKRLLQLSTPHLPEIPDNMIPITNNTIKKRLFMTPPSQSPKSKYIEQSLTDRQLSTEKNRVQGNNQNTNISGKYNLTPSCKDSSNNACVICFDSMPDSVFMPCGHGGLCYSCAVCILNNTGECYLCREPIREIVRLNLHDKDSQRGYRVVAMMTLVDESNMPDSERKQTDNIHSFHESINADGQGSRDTESQQLQPQQLQHQLALEQQQGQQQQVPALQLQQGQ